MISQARLPSDEHHWTLVVISQYWFRYWLVAVRAPEAKISYHSLDVRRYKNDHCLNDEWTTVVYCHYLFVCTHELPDFTLFCIYLPTHLALNLSDITTEIFVYMYPGRKIVNNSEVGYWVPFLNFSTSKIFDHVKVPLISIKSQLYLTGAMATDLRRHLSNIKVIFNS